MYIAKPYTIVLFGHREFNEHNTLEDLLYPLLKHLIKTKSFVRIYIGRNGEFDLYTATILKRVQKAIGKDNNELVCVLPYSHKDIKYFEEYYDDVIIPECIGKTHPKGAITKRNRWMVEQADLLICYVQRNEGGAYAAMKYAEKLGKRIINVAENAGFEKD